MRSRREAEKVEWGASIDPRDLLRQLNSTRRRIGELQATSAAITSRIDSFLTLLQIQEQKLVHILEDSDGLSFDEKKALVGELAMARTNVAGNWLSKRMLKGSVKFPVSRCVSVQAMAKKASAPVGPKPAPKPFAAWIEKQCSALLDPAIEGSWFTAVHLGFIGPIWSDGLKTSEGIQTPDGTIAALAPRERADQPVQIMIGVPGAGKTHHALELMGRGKGRIFAFGPTPGSRQQLGLLAGKLQISERLTVVSKPRDLRRRSRVIIDEASRVSPTILRHLQGAKELFLAGDAGQSEAGPGQSLLGVIAALGAPVIELTESRRTLSTAIRLIGQFVSATDNIVIPSLDRIEPDKAVELVQCNEGEELQTIIRMAEGYEDCLVVVFTEEMLEALLTAGVRAYRGDAVQGAEAKHVIVHLPADWKDEHKTPAVPYLSFLNAICRARSGASILTAALSNIEVDKWGAAKTRIEQLDQVVFLATTDPRDPERHPLSRWGDAHWAICDQVTDALFELNHRADLIGDWLFVYRISEPARYCGAILIGAPRLGVTEAMVLDSGFEWVERCELSAGDDADAAWEITRRLIVRLGQSRSRDNGLVFVSKSI